MGKDNSLAERFTVEGLEQYHQNLEERLKEHSLRFHNFPQAFEKISRLGDEDSDVRVVGLKIPQAKEEEMKKMQNEMSVPTMITVEEAAKLTGLPPYLIRRMCYREEIVHIRIGGERSKVYINQEKLLEHLNTNKSETGRKKSNDYEK